ncbi:MAG: type II secretion system F family protein, partial [Planctomycetota bacterium]
LAAELAAEIQAGRNRPRTPESGLLGLALPFLPVASAVGRALHLETIQRSLAQRYARAGYPGGIDDEDLVGLGLLLGLPLALPLMLMLSLLSPWLAPLGMVGVLAGPGLLSSRYESMGTVREQAISRSMPFVLDLLVLTMRAGSSLQQSVKRVAQDYEDQPIGREFAAVLGDLGAGTTAREAFENMQERVPIDSVRGFVDDLVQGEELGRPLADVFERLADQARLRRVQDATDAAGRAKVLVLIPGMLVFVAVLLLLFAPFFVRWFYGGFEI